MTKKCIIYYAFKYFRKVNTTIYLNTITGSPPLNLITNSSSSSTIHLGGLDSYGTANQILKTNSSGNGLTWGSGSDNIYTGGTHIAITGSNVINDTQTDTTYTARTSGSNVISATDTNTNYFTKTSSNISPIQNADDLLINMNWNQHKYKERLIISGN